MASSSAAASSKETPFDWDWSAWDFLDFKKSTGSAGQAEATGQMPGCEQYLRYITKGFLSPSAQDEQIKRLRAVRKDKVEPVPAPSAGDMAAHPKPFETTQNAALSTAEKIALNNWHEQPQASAAY